MSHNGSMKHFNGTPKAKTRRVSTIERLEKQLKSGMKPPKKTDQTVSDIPLMEVDIVRINKELAILKNRI